MDLVKEICKQLLDSIAIVQQTDDVLRQWISFELYNVSHYQHQTYSEWRALAIINA